MHSIPLRSALVVLLASSCARAPLEPLAADSARSFTGPDSTEVDLLRVYPSAGSIYVQARLPDGQLGLFLVDTGAATSVLSEETAERLGLEITRDFGSVEGLGGRAQFHRGVIPYVEIGDAIIPSIEVAVGVPGVGSMRGAMPFDGILGNNVWSRFVLEVDYPADVLALHRPGTVRLPRRADPMFFDGSHVFAPVDLTTTGGGSTSDRVIIQVDTGAHGLMLVGPNDARFDGDFTEGIEPIFGIGGGELRPVSSFHKVTRHMAIDEVRIGGRSVEVDLDAQWVNFDGNDHIGPAGLRGLAGHELLAGHALWLDYKGGQIALGRSHRKKRQVDGHQVLLDQDIATYGDDASRYLFRGRLQAFLGEAETSEELLEGFVSYAAEQELDPAELAKAHVLLATVRRALGDLDGAWEALEPLGAGQLVDEGEIVAAVNGLILEGRPADAMTLASAAVAERPEEVAAHVAYADALLAGGHFDQATDSLAIASRLAENPDAHLLRRARIALAQGDRYGAMAQVRKLLKLYPYEGLFLWYYAELIEGDDSDTFRADMQQAMERLHPSDRPLDFLVAANRTLGDDETALSLMHEGIARDCSQAPSPSSDKNCHAWYWALAGIEPADALHHIDEALAETGDRSDFLDTKAMVHLSRGEYAEAHEAALAAARLAPDDIYMLWQASRLAILAGAEAASGE